ncbi:MAG: lysophospholipid acyltransferase family protein [Coriobacteriales bacterium]|jgi:1-acyl-sn-glycerol-3-phosphate acyltransferase
MIIEEKRNEVVENIRKATEAKAYNVCVEPDDPTPSAEERKEIRERFLKNYGSLRYRFNNFIARGIIRIATYFANRHTPIYGLEKIEGIEGGAMITSNHFSPIDNTVVRKLVRAKGKRHMPVVGLESNLAMKGLFGFLMNYAELIPISNNARYMHDHFGRLLQERIDRGDFVLMYPEQQMWFNYRLPRPCKRGTYYYAARMNVPVISCFVEIRDKEDLETPNFVEVSYAMHVLDPIYPDPNLSARENSIAMAEKDYRQKVAAYERIYGKKLDYRFDPEDIAGWIPTDEEKADAAPKLEEPAFEQGLIGVA